MFYGEYVNDKVDQFRPKSEAEQRNAQEAAGVAPNEVQILSETAQFGAYVLNSLSVEYEQKMAQDKSATGEATIGRAEITDKIRSLYPEYHPNEQKLDNNASHRNEARIALAQAAYRSLMPVETAMLKRVGVVFSRAEHTLLSYARYGVPEDSALCQLAVDYLARAEQADRERAQMDAELQETLKKQLPETKEAARKAQYDKAIREGKTPTEANGLAVDAANAAASALRSDLSQRMEEKFSAKWAAPLTQGRSDLIRTSREQLIRSAPAFDKRLGQVVRDGRLIEEWPTLGVALACYGESQDFGNREVTEGLISRIMVLKTEMNYYAGSICDQVDFEEFKKLGREKANHVNDAFLADGYISLDLGAYAGVCATTNDSYFTEALQSFHLTKAEELSCQTPEGRLLEPGSEALWNHLFGGNPVYVVPRDDPGAEPVLVQPTDRFGGAATFTDLSSVRSSEIPDAPAPAAAKPNGFLSLLDSILSAIGRVFNADWRIASCRAYENSAAFGKALAGAKRNLPRLAEPQSVDKVRRVFAAGRSPEELQAIHESVIRAREDAAAKETARKQAYTDDLEAIKAAAPTQKALDDQSLGQSYQEFYNFVHDGAQHSPYKAASAANIIRQGHFADLFAEYKAVLAGTKSGEASSQTVDAAITRLPRRLRAAELVPAGDAAPDYAAFRADVLNAAAASEGQLKRLEKIVKAGDLPALLAQYRRLGSSEDRTLRVQQAMINLEAFQDNLGAIQEKLRTGGDTAYQQFSDDLMRYAGSGNQAAEEMNSFGSRENYERLYQLYQAEPEAPGSERVVNAAKKLSAAQRAEQRAQEGLDSILRDQMKRIEHGLRPKDDSDPAYAEFRRAVIEGAKRKPQFSAGCAVFADAGYMETMFLLYKENSRNPSAGPNQTVIEKTLDDMVRMHRADRLPAENAAVETAAKAVESAKGIGSR